MTKHGQDKDVCLLAKREKGERKRREERGDDLFFVLFQILFLDKVSVGKSHRTAKYFQLSYTNKSILHETVHFQI